ncbi:hypothetical protein, partial [Escherichia coli]|uniref:hypothetical protein n=1 Tax=Escherichia coli TaxID=562 RepID=UPI001BDD96BF
VVLRAGPRQQALGDGQAANGGVIVVDRKIKLGAPVAAGVIGAVNAHRAQLALGALGMLLDAAGQQGLEFIFGLQTALHRHLLNNRELEHRARTEFRHDPVDTVSASYRVTSRVQHDRAGRTRTCLTCGA